METLNSNILHNKKIITLETVTKSIFFVKLTVSPNFSPLSEATLSETEIAAMRLGCVQIILHTAPRNNSISDSRINCGTCVVFPQPVSPEMITT